MCPQMGWKEFAGVRWIVGIFFFFVESDNQALRDKQFVRPSKPKSRYNMRNEYELACYL